MAEYQYNDYSGYFGNLESDIPLTIKDNVKLFKSLQTMIEEYFSISANQDLEQIKKDELIMEMASTLEQIYLNSGQPHLIETIASSLCLILNQKDYKITSPSHIHNVLEKKYKRKYSCEVGKSKRGDIFSLRNVRFSEFKEGIAKCLSFYRSLPLNLEYDKHEELVSLMNQLQEAHESVLHNIDMASSYSSSSSSSSSITDEPSFKNMPEYIQENLPQERETTSYSSSYSLPSPSPSSVAAHGDYDDDDNNSSNISSNESSFKNNNGNGGSRTPIHHTSKYYLRLEQYISVLQKLKDNVLKYPPSKELDEKLDKALALEIDLLMPSIDMKFKRSIPQLDETIQYADSQSLNGASSVMHETALIQDNERGTIEDPNYRYRRFLEITHKLTPEQIDTRRPYISVIRKKMKYYQPHIFYHLLWYEGTRQFDHNLSMGKFARSNLLKKKMVT